MFLPLGTDLRLRRPTVVNHALVAINLAIFVAMFAVTVRDPEHFDAIVGKWGLLWIPAEWWRFLTYSVVHDGIWHVAGNMLMLWVFGPPVEDRMGRVGYLALYLVGTVGAAAAHVATSHAPAVGGSGAVAAVCGAFLVLFPKVHIRTFILFFTIGMYQIPALWFIGFCIAKDFFAAGLGGAADNVARAAHLGGYGVGIATAFMLQLTKVVPREPFDFLSLVTQAKRRNQIRAALAEAEEDRTRRFGLSGNSTTGRFDKPRKGTPKHDAARSDALALARAKVTDLISREQLAEAAGAYQELLALHTPEHAATDGPLPGTAVMSRRPQMVLANWFFEQSRHAEAMSAFERYVAAYPLDSETPHVKLLMALIAARYLKQAETARTLINEAMPKLKDEEQQGLAKQILEELGPPNRA